MQMALPLVVGTPQSSNPLALQNWAYQQPEAVPFPWRRALPLLAALTLALSSALLPLAASARLAMPTTLCFEKLSDIPGIYLQEHPNRKYLVVATQDGLIQITTKPGVQQGSMNVLGTFLDLRSRTLDSGERGLLSFAFHPKFLRNGRVFVYYICDSKNHPDCQGNCTNPSTGSNFGDCSSNTVVAEYNVPAGVSPASAMSLSPNAVRKVLGQARPFPNHNGGHIWFGLDGLLYITQGDGGSAGDPFNLAQNGDALFGKVLRINVNNLAAGQGYTVPRDNPFVGVAGVRPEVFALGLRNPWRCSLDRKRKKVFCGDVGQDSWEEVDILVKGQNYGWPKYEANAGYKSIPQGAVLGGSYTFPILAYSHTDPSLGGDNGRAVIGGHVYRAKRNKCLRGRYIFSDYKRHMFVAQVYPTTSKAQYVQVSFACPGSASCSLATAQQNSWSTDLSNELYHLSNNGVHRLIDGSLCGAKC